MQSLKNGTQLGAYTLIRLIARGGMGEVYEAHELQLQRRVALKIIAPTNPDEHDREDLIRRFMQEARTLARVNHPNVVTIYSIESKGGTPFIAMEYIEGVSFRQVLEELTFTTDGAIPIFLQMLEGLKSLHDNRVVHRDLKPHNISLRPDGTVKILDFGIAKSVGQNEHTRTGVVVGTLPYMAPELKNGQSATMRSDLWSLGAIFFEMLAGLRLVESMPDGDIEYPIGVAGKIPAEMRDIIAKMCAHRPTDRYLVAEQVIDDLRKLQASRPPVPSAVWTTLAKKVEELARAQRTQSDLEQPPSSPKMIATTVLAKNALEQPPAPAEAPLPAPVSPSVNQAIREGHPRTGTAGHRRPKKRKKSNRGLYAGAVAGLALLAFVLFGPNKTPAPPAPVVVTPANPTPVTVPIAPAPMPALPLALREPSDQQLLWLEPTRLPTLSWSRALGPNEYDIQIATDPAFKKIIVQEPVSGSTFRPERVLPEGAYHWRLQPRREALKGAGPNRFTVAYLAGPELARPDAGHTFDFGKGGEVEFAWGCKSGAKQYVIQVAADEQFSRPVAERTVTGCKWTSPRLPPGDYRWRVRMADVEPAHDLWSVARPFSMKAAEPARAKPVELALTEPKLIDARQTFTLGFVSVPRDLASVGKNARELPRLEWRTVRGASKYLVQISTSRDFNGLLTEETVTTTHLEWRGVVPGTAYWRVAAVGPGGPANFSERGVLQVRLPAPAFDASTKIKIPGGAESGQQANIEWEPVPLAAKYVVQLSAKRDLAGAEERLVSRPRLSLNGTPSTHFVRVAAADEAGQPLSEYSSVGVVQIEAAFVLEAPRLLSPNNKARAPAQAGRISVIFSWSQVTGADGYIFELARDPQFTQVIDRKTSRNRGTLLQQAELKGRVYWRVRATSPQGNSAWSEPFHIDIK